MIYLESTSTDPYFNLALEEYVFEQMDPAEECFMLWQNYNTIVVGKYQNTAEEINHEYVEAKGIRVVRRLSGGGAVYHDRGNLNFTFVTSQAENEDFDFKRFVRPVVEALETLGVHAEFGGRNDITIKGQKFSGNSQYARHGRLLHHGCIMLDSNLENVAAALNVRAAKFQSKSIKSVRSRVTTINKHAPQSISMDAFKAALRGRILSCGAKKRTLCAPELAAVERLRDEKYATWDWNYGASPQYNMHREMKFPAGMVSAFLEVGGGVIRALRLYGDFFGKGDLRQLEQAIMGLPLDGKLQINLEKLDVGYFISGLSAAELCLLLR